MVKNKAQDVFESEAQVGTGVTVRPPGLADTVRIRVFCPSYRPATVWKEKKLTSFPNENRKGREKYILYFLMLEIELYCTRLMPETYGYIKASPLGIVLDPNSSPPQLWGGQTLHGSPWHQ